MKILYDFFPILLFFIAYKLYGIYAATMVAIVASIAQVGYAKFKHGKVENMHLVSLALIVVLGGLTVFLQDKSFIMWKPTLINWLFAAVFFGSMFIGEKPLIKRMLGGQIKLEDGIWKRLNHLWIAFFIFSGAINIYFVQHYLQAEQALIAVAPDTNNEDLKDFNCDVRYTGEAHPLCLEAKSRESLWVNFKLFGLLGLTIIFVIGQAFYLSRYMQEDDDNDNDKPKDNLLG